MDGKLRYILLLILGVTLPLSPFAQAHIYHIDKIEISGNNRTEDYVILRELNFKKGDTVTISELPGLFEQGKRQLESMGIFAQADFNIQEISSEDRTVHITIEIQERWPIYPVPLLELADRNFNIWWKTYHLNLRRVNYGLKLYHINFTGRNDELKGKVQVGFSQKYELKYSLPSLQYFPDWGIEGNALLGLEKNIRVRTLGHRELFIKSDDNILYHRFRLEGGVVYRHGLHNRYKLRIGYHKNKIDDLVVKLNENFLGEGKNEQRYFNMAADWLHDNRNNKAFSTSGKLLQLQLIRYGLHKNHDVNYFETLAYANYAKDLSDDWTLHIHARGRYQFTTEILPYTHRRGLNWEDAFLEAYDYFLLDGKDYATLKLGIYKKVYTHELSLGSWIPFESYEVLTLDIILGFLTSAGYLQDNNTHIENYLTERLLYGMGPEINVLVNNFIMGTGQVAVNHMGQVGFYLRAKVAFSL